MIPVRCHQARIRQHEARKLYVEPVPDLRRAFVREITSQQAKAIILRYEWLGTMGRSFLCYGLFSGRDPATVKAGWLVDENERRIMLPTRTPLEVAAPYAVVDGQELIGVACLGWPGGNESRFICGHDESTREEFAKRTIAIERGTCVHWAHPHSASFLIPKVCKLANFDPSCEACRAKTCTRHGFEIFYAYSDVSAGEIGTVYQAANWHYIGQGVGRPTRVDGEARPREMFVPPNSSKALTSRALRHRKLTKKQVLAAGWQVFKVPAKHKYVWFEGRYKRQLYKACRYPFLPYPKWQLSTSTDPAPATVTAPDPAPSREGVAAVVTAVEPDH